MRNAPAPQTTWRGFVLESRRAARLSQQGLADALGVNKTTVWRWENEDRRPETPELAMKVAQVTHQQPTAALLAAGFAPPIEVDDPRLHGLDRNSVAVRHIMSLDVDEEERGFLLDHQRQIDALRAQQDIAEIDMRLKRDRERRQSPPPETGRRKAS